MNIKLNESPSDIDLITEHIINGLRSGYKENNVFTQNYTNLQSRVIEYLIVVNVAQALKEFCEDKNIKINLECSLNEFYNNAFPRSIIIGTNVFDMDIVN